jgi:hypothetical protein
MSQNYSTVPIPQSPSWRMKAPRSGVLSPKRLSGPYRKQTSHEDSSGSSWFVLSPMLENNVYPSPSLIGPLAHSPRPQAVVAKPFLTLALIKLDELLPGFLNHLSHPTFQSVTKACSLLDSSIGAPASISSPHTNRNNHTSSPGGSPNSPLGLFRFFSSSPSSSSPRSSNHSSPCSSPSSSPSAMALEGEWEGLVTAPLWLLAAAEVLAADLYHLTAGETACALLKGLYQRCTQDLFRLQRLLCDPILAAYASPLQSRTSGAVVEAARSVHAALETLVLLISCRCQFLEVQASLVDNKLSAATGMGVILHRLETHEVTAAATLPLYTLVVQQVRAWKYALEACLAVEQCL